MFSLHSLTTFQNLNLAYRDSLKTFFVPRLHASRLVYERKNNVVRHTSWQRYLPAVSVVKKCAYRIARSRKFIINKMYVQTLKLIYSDHISKEERKLLYMDAIV
jgi:hypothetical protein